MCDGVRLVCLLRSRVRLPKPGQDWNAEAASAAGGGEGVSSSVPAGFLPGGGVPEAGFRRGLWVAARLPVPSSP